MPQKLIHARTNCSALYFLTELMHDACTVRYVELTAGKKVATPVASVALRGDYLWPERSGERGVDHRLSDGKCS